MRWRGVLIHHTASVDTEAAEIQSHRDYHVHGRGWRDLGYHFVCELVDNGVEVVAGRPLNLPGAHCPGKNTTHIGFAFNGDFSEFGPSAEMLATASRFLAGLLDALEIPTATIEPHRAYRATACPGVLDVEAFRELVDRQRIGGDS